MFVVSYTCDEIIAITHTRSGAFSAMKRDIATWTSPPEDPVLKPHPADDNIFQIFDGGFLYDDYSCYCLTELEVDNDSE